MLGACTRIPAWLSLHRLRSSGPPSVQGQFKLAFFGKPSTLNTAYSTWVKRGKWSLEMEAWLHQSTLVSSLQSQLPDFKEGPPSTPLSLHRLTRPVAPHAQLWAEPRPSEDGYLLCPACSAVTSCNDDSWGDLFVLLRWKESRNLDAGCHLDTGEERQWVTEANRGGHGQGQQVARVASSVCHELFHPFAIICSLDCFVKPVWVGPSVSTFSILTWPTSAQALGWCGQEEVRMAVMTTYVSVTGSSLHEVVTSVAPNTL